MALDAEEVDRRDEAFVLEFRIWLPGSSEKSWHHGTELSEVCDRGKRARNTSRPRVASRFKDYLAVSADTPRQILRSSEAFSAENVYEPVRVFVEVAGAVVGVGRSEKLCFFPSFFPWLDWIHGKKEHFFQHALRRSLPVPGSDGRGLRRG